MRYTDDGMEIGMGVAPYQGKIRQEELGTSIRTASQGQNHIKEMTNTHPKAHINRQTYTYIYMCVYMYVCMYVYSSITVISRLGHAPISTSETRFWRAHADHTYAYLHK